MDNRLINLQIWACEYILGKNDRWKWGANERQSVKNIARSLKSEYPASRQLHDLGNASEENFDSLFKDALVDIGVPWPENEQKATFVILKDHIRGILNGADPMCAAASITLMNYRVWPEEMRKEEKLYNGFAGVACMASAYWQWTDDIQPSDHYSSIEKDELYKEYEGWVLDNAKEWWDKYKDQDNFLISDEHYDPEIYKKAT